MKKQSKQKEENNILMKMKKFFNNPTPIIIILIAIIAILLIFIAKFNTKSKIYVGEINKNGLQVANIHYFINNDMNYFYADPATYTGEEKKVYAYQIGYFVVDEENNYIELASRSNTEAVGESKLSQLVSEMSSWNFGETASATYFFTNDVIKHLDNLHFVIRAASKKDSNEADVFLDYKVELTKITK